MILQTRLMRRYRIKAGVPSLILLEGGTGSVVTRGGVERALDDPTGANFPWRPPHPKRTLEDGPLLPCGARDSSEPMLHEELRYCVKGVYFSAHWVRIPYWAYYFLLVYYDECKRQRSIAKITPGAYEAPLKLIRPEDSSG